MNLVEMLAIYHPERHSTAHKVQDIFTNPWKDHIPKISFVDPDGLPDAAPMLPSIGQVKKILKSYVFENFRQKKGFRKF